MKVWPVLFVCQYGTQAFLLQWYRFTAIRGHPAVAVSDCGSQLTSAKNAVAFPDREAPENWDWDGVKHDGAGRGTVWRFVPPGAQFRNGLAERRVAALKHTLDHLLANTLMATKPTLNYAELCTMLERAAPTLLPYYRWEETKRHKNLREGDVCLLLYE